MKDKLIEILDMLKIPAEIAGVVDAPQLTKLKVDLLNPLDRKKIDKNKLVISSFLRVQDKELQISNSADCDVEITVPKKDKRTVQFKELQAIERKPLEAVFGVDSDNKPVKFNFDEKHLLVAGASGAGKSVVLNDIICSLLYRNKPSELRFLMIDPKRVELMKYEGLPHLLGSVITKASHAIKSLDSVVALIKERYELMSRYGYKKYSDYNKHAMYPIIPVMVVIDEVATLMEHSKYKAESLIIQIAQLGRAAGVSMILCTQNPRVQYISGNIKANLVNRVALTVGDITASKNIIDYGGAEKLTGKGDALFKTEDKVSMTRFQSAYITDDEIAHIVNEHIKLAEQYQN